MVDDLKEIHLLLQSAERCNKSAQDNMEGFNEKTFTERMFCAGDGKGMYCNVYVKLKPVGQQHIEGQGLLCPFQLSRLKAMR